MIEFIELEKKEAPAGRRGQGADNSDLGAAIYLDCTRFSMPYQSKINEINWGLMLIELELNIALDNFARETAKITAATEALGGE